MADCERALAQGSSVYFFPEGTRSRTGELKPFKPGAFTLAKRARVPLLPIVLEGTARALPRRGFVLQGRHAIRVRVLDEIPYATFADVDAETLARRMHLRYANLLEPAGQAAGLGGPAVVNAD